LPDDHQHYVPQFLLRNFGTGNRNKQIWVFDKQDGRSFRTAIRNIASEGGFYDFSEVGERRSLDPAMQKLEDWVIEDFRRINQQRTIPTDMEARLRIAFFAAVQNVRTEAYRQQYKQLTKLRNDVIAFTISWVKAYGRRSNRGAAGHRELRASLSSAMKKQTASQFG
jgi:hypothetical protein